MTIEDLVIFLRNYFQDNGEIKRQENLYGLTDGINYNFYFSNYPIKENSEKIFITDNKRQYLIPNTEYSIDLENGTLTFNINNLIAITGNEILKSKFRYERNNEEMVIENSKDLIVSVVGDIGIGKYTIDGNEYVCGTFVEDVIYGYKIGITDTLDCQIDDKITIDTKYSIPPRNSIVMSDYKYLKYTDDKIKKYINNALIELNSKYKNIYVIDDDGNIKPIPDNYGKALIILQANILRLIDELQNAIDESIIYGSGGERIDKTQKTSSLQRLLSDEQKRYENLLKDRNTKVDLLFTEYSHYKSFFDGIKIL